MSAKKKTLRNCCKLCELLSTPGPERPRQMGQQQDHTHTGGHICTIGNAGIEDAWGPFPPHDKDRLKQVTPWKQVSQMFY